MANGQAKQDVAVLDHHGHGARIRGFLRILPGHSVTTLAAASSLGSAYCCACDCARASAGGCVRGRQPVCLHAPATARYVVVCGWGDCDSLSLPMSDLRRKVIFTLHQHAHTIMVHTSVRGNMPCGLECLVPGVGGVRIRGGGTAGRKPHP